VAREADLLDGHPIIENSCPGQSCVIWKGDVTPHAPEHNCDYRTPGFSVVLSCYQTCSHVRWLLLAIAHATDLTSATNTVKDIPPSSDELREMKRPSLRPWLPPSLRPGGSLGAANQPSNSEFRLCRTSWRRELSFDGLECATSW